MRDHRDTMEPYEPSDPAYDWEYDGEPAEHNAPTILWGRVAVLGAALLLAFLLGRLTAGGGVPEEDLTAARQARDEAQEQVTQLEGQIAALQDDLDALENPTDTGDETTDAGDETTDAGDETTGGEEDPTAEGRSYTVQSGDTLRDIANEMYCNAAADDFIAEANPDDVGAAPDYIISVGAELFIPDNPDIDEC